jgi:hypothetical protein
LRTVGVRAGRQVQVGAALVEHVQQQVGEEGAVLGRVLRADADGYRLVRRCGCWGTAGGRGRHGHRSDRAGATGAAAEPRRAAVRSAAAVDVAARVREDGAGAQKSAGRALARRVDGVRRAAAGAEARGGAAGADPKLIVLVPA